ncbi:thiamine pyrophosphate-dependent enzyme [Halovivax limisalsi]|uniref:thiamine pyrophosphate-dependent enzyme n=1 Tax=Halovivax limisalsi TaxID=1453760 RepID=UPI001FFC8CD4|nr:thiamine pyrophosphate-dependent enzyme [Halovivax limisalsi]
MDADDSSAPVEGAAEAYLRLFDRFGVDVFFNSPGSDDAPYWEFLTKHSADDDTDAPVPAYVNCRHESVAVNMARGYTMVTGRAQVVKLHINTGTLHAAMDLHASYHSGTPMIVLSSYAATHENEQFGGSPGPHYLRSQEPGGHENNVKRYTKWVCPLDTNDNAEQLLSRAYNVASASPQGPVFVNISRELAHDRSKETVEFVEPTVPSPPFPDPETFEALVDRLEGATNPLLLTGSYGTDPDAVPDLVRLAETLEMPIYETEKRVNNFPMDHPLYLGAGLLQSDTLEAYLAKDVDLVFVLDSPFPWYPPRGGAPTDAEIVMVDEDPLQERSHYWNYPADLLVEADSAALVPALADRVSPTSVDRPVDWRDEHEKWRRRWDRAAEDGRDEQPIDPFWLCRVLDETLPDDALIHDETVVHTSIVANLVRTTAPDRIGTLQANRGGLGVGLGVALGAKLARPERTGVLLVGDGAFNYNAVAAAFGTAQEHDLPILVVVFNNESYESMRTSHRLNYPDGWAEDADTYVGASIEPTPEYADIVSSWGGYGEKVADPDEIGPALERGLDAVSTGRIAVVDVVLEDGFPSDPTPE